MEVPGRNTTRPSDSVTGASLEEVELFCDPCSIEGHHLPVTGFCVDCNHYLCETCFKHHCLPLPMKNHLLMDKYAMPKKKNRTLMKDKCTQHAGKSIQYFCKLHSQLGCSACLATGNTCCGDVTYIPNIANEIEGSEEYKNFITKLNKTKDKFDFNEKKTKVNRSESEKYYSEVIKTVKELREDINTMFNELENKIEQVAKLSLDADIDRMSAISSKCDKAIKDIETLKSDMEIFKRSRQYQNLFIRMKKSQKDVDALEDDLAMMARENMIIQYQFVPDEQIKDLLENLKLFGQLKIAGDLKAKHLQDIKISLFKELISGLRIMSDGQIAVISGDSAMLVNTQQNKVTSKLHLPSSPWDITETAPGELAVTLNRKQVIQFLSASDTLSKGHEVKVNGKCRGIMSYMDKLAVTFCDPAKVEIMKMDGTVLKVLSTDASGGRLFINPHYIAISPDHTILHISDFNNHSLTNLTLEGEIIATYKDDDLKQATGICVDRDGTVYVCGHNSNNVHQITAGGEKLQILLNKTDGVKSPSSIAYSDQDNKLYIGMSSNNMLNIFHLHY